MGSKDGVLAITEKILDQAKAWTDDQTAAAKAESDELERQYAAQAKEAYDKALLEASEKAAALRDRAQGQGEMDKRKMLLAAKQECVQEAFSLALQKLCALSDEEKVRFMVGSASKYQTADAELIFNTADKAGIGSRVVDEVNAALKASGKPFSARMSEQTGSFAGGFVLKQGDVESNCTFEVLIGGVREELEGETSSILFS